MGLHLAAASLSLLILAQPALACTCDVSFAVCKEVGASQLVFIGTVESIEPLSLNRWNSPTSSSAQALNDAYIEATQHPSAAALNRLKDAYLKIFPDLAPEANRRLLSAKTAAEVSAQFSSSLDREMRVRFKVRELFKHEDDDKKGDDDEGSFDVWTATGDCGFDFQVGETYLVYANDDEGSNLFFTSSCTRTTRLSDAGPDLAYLFFYKNDRKESARVEGFLTTDRLGYMDFSPAHEPGTIKSPAVGVIVELQSDSLRRYAQSDKNGRFLFDGLPEGDYRIKAFDDQYPFKTQVLAGPQPLHVEAEGCARQILLLPKNR